MPIQFFECKPGLGVLLRAPAHGDKLLRGMIELKTSKGTRSSGPNDFN